MERKPYSFDGHGINGPDEYRTRLFTFTEAGLAMGPLLEEILNNLTISATNTEITFPIDLAMQRLLTDGAVDAR